MTIYPAIDIKGGKCVRLTQGRADQETVYFENPADVARAFRDAGSAWIHAVDLDGAFEGAPRNLAALEAILAVGLKVQFGGGLRSEASVARVLGLGVSRAVIGTRAAESEAFVAGLVSVHGEKIAVGIDAKDGRVAVKGWVDTTSQGAVALARRMGELGVSTLIHTDIGNDGMLTGPNYAAQEAMCRVFSGRVVASGGVSAPADVTRLRELAGRCPNLEGVIIGKAIYEKRIDLASLLKS
jgi:phosphoribosylformimino-5-aminoimidazole carboxamide ribotide isomerase